MTETTNTGTPASTATEATTTTAATTPAVAAPTSALAAAAAKSDGVESMLAAASKAAAAAPESHDYGKLKADGVHADVMKALAEGFGEHKIAPEAAQKLLDKVLPAMNARREAEVKEADAAWQKELREDKEIGGDKYEHNTKLVEAAVAGLLSPEHAKAAKESGLLGHPAFVRFALAAERVVASATKQDTATRGGGITRELSAADQWRKANPKTASALNI